MLSVVSPQYKPWPWLPLLRFQGVARQEGYLKRLQALTPPARDAFASIYAEAVETRGGGGHIVNAAIWAMRLPEIFGLARENLVMRLQLSRARAKQDADKVQRLEERLEDFHVAADAYVQNRPLNVVAQQRQLGQKSDSTCAKMRPGYVHPMHNDLPGFGLFRRFVELMRPYLRGKGGTSDLGLSLLRQVEAISPPQEPIQ